MHDSKSGWAKLVIGAALLLMAAVGLKIYGPEWDSDALVNRVLGLSGSLFIAGFLILPLVGMPITIFLMATGLKFGVAMGMLVTAGCIAFHHLVAYRLTHSFFKQRVERFLTRRGRHIPDVPKRHQVWFTVAFAAVHSLPYSAKLYLLALTNISFRIYFWLGWPTYALCSLVFVGLGQAAARPTWNWIIALILLGALLAAISHCVHKKIRQKLMTDRK
jgi:uncharacterized membrane protein YdjX (TVP38/TMEM64 family)